MRLGDDAELEPDGEALPRLARIEALWEERVGDGAPRMLGNVRRYYRGQQVRQFLPPCSPRWCSLGGSPALLRPCLRPCLRPRRAPPAGRAGALADVLVAAPLLVQETPFSSIMQPGELCSSDLLLKCVALGAVLQRANVTWPADAAEAGAAAAGGSFFCRWFYDYEAGTLKALSPPS